MKLYDAINTWPIALLMLKKKGYKICIELENNNIVMYEAVNERDKFRGKNPLALLGLVNIAEEYGGEWHKIKAEDLCNKTIEISVTNIKTELGYKLEFEYGKIVINNFEELLDIIIECDEKIIVK
jgi:hypothetical protein